MSGYRALFGQGLRCAFELLLHADFRMIHSNGVQDTKASYIDGVRARKWDYRPRRPKRAEHPCLRANWRSVEPSIDQHPGRRRAARTRRTRSQRLGPFRRRDAARCGAISPCTAGLPGSPRDSRPPHQSPGSQVAAGVSGISARLIATTAGATRSSLIATKLSSRSRVRRDLTHCKGAMASESLLVRTCHQRQRRLAAHHDSRRGQVAC